MGKGQPSSILFYGGDIVTMERPDDDAEAVLIQDGVIQKVGTRDEVFALRRSDTEMRDLQGKALLPSFIDPHSHLTQYALTFGMVSLENAQSFEDIAIRLRTFQRERQIKDGAWICGYGYDHHLLVERRHPDKHLLDHAFPDNPVIISHASGHMGVLNSLALHSSGITRDTPVPEGGVIGRETDGYEPNGYLEETAFTSLPQRAAPSRESLYVQMEQAQENYLQYGITTVQDGLTRESEWSLLKKMSEDERLSVDVVSYVDLKQCKSLADRFYPQYCAYKNHLRMGGYKIFLDGSPQGRTAWLTRPYENAVDGYSGYPIYPDETVFDLMKTAVQDGIQVLVHCNGDAAAQQMLDAYGRVLNDFPNDHDEIRPVMVHAQLLRRDQLARMAAQSVIASFFVAHTYYWGDVHLQNLGPERAHAISPIRSAIQNGILYTLHQDTPVIRPDMMETVWCACNRVTKSGVVLGEEERVSVYDALRGVTSNAAYQYFEEEQKGSICAGKNADLVIVERNPLKTPLSDLRKISVLQTMKDGNVLFSQL